MKIKNFIIIGLIFIFLSSISYADIFVNITVPYENEIITAINRSWIMVEVNETFQTCTLNDTRWTKRTEPFYIYEDSYITVINDTSNWGTTYPVTNAYDKDWDTFTISQTTVSTSTIYFNYTKPYWAQNTSLWQIKDHNTETNLTINASCWNQSNTTLQLKAVSNGVSVTTEWLCYGGTNWIRMSFDVLNALIYEQAVWWDTTQKDFYYQENGTAYNWTGDWIAGFEGNLSYDGDWATGSRGDKGTLYMNYTKPSLATNESLWQVLYYDSPPAFNYVNYSLPTECWEQDILQFRMENDWLTEGGFNLTCRNSTGWHIFLSETDTGIMLFEEAMWWDIVNYPYVNNEYLSDGIYSVNASCTGSFGEYDDSIRTFTLDTTNPILVTVFINNSLIYKNLTGQFNFSDNIGLHSINISIDGTTIFNITNINNPTYILNLSHNISALSIGKHNLSIYWADGHTAKEIGDYKESNGLFNDYLKYEFYDNGNIKTELKSKSILDKWSSEKRKDRYIQILEPSNPSDTITLIEESDMPIYIAYKEGSYNDYWIIMGNHWKDYVLENEPNVEVSMKRINQKKVEVTISGIKNKDKLIFSSVGDLNTVTREYSFYAINMTETYDAFITEGFSFNLDLAVDFGDLEFDISGITPFAILQWNNTNFTSTLVSYTSTGTSFRKTLSPIGIETIETIIHNWWFNFSTFTDGYLRTNNASQIALSVDVDVCNETVINYTILNLTYFDEVNDENIDITNSYQLKITDGTHYYNQTGSFVNNFSSTFCTNLNPLEVAYNWDMWGLMTLSKATYITRVLNIDEAVPIALSNAPTTNLSLFLVGTLNSSTVTYTWQTTGFQPIDGTMRIFRCNDDGSQDLIESTPIISGEATANIQLLLQTYSYDVIINGIVFRDLESYSRCHVESTTERTFFVDVDPIDIAPLIGLAGIRCSLEESAINNSITITWTANPQLEGYVSGCIVADRRTIRGSVNVLDNCSIESEGYTRTLAVSVVDGNTYVVRGRLEQGNNQINCVDTVILTPGQAQGGLFGVSGLLAVIFLVCSLALIYASDGEFMLAGGAIGLIISWFLGILVFDWIVVSGIIFFFALIAVTGRYTRKR